MVDEDSSPRRFCRFVNAAAIIVLTVAVVILFVQLQIVSHTVATVHHDLEQLQERVDTKQQDEIQELSDQVQQERSLTIIHMAGTFTLLTCLLSMFHMTMHLRDFHEPIIQRKILAILWMSPIYAITSFTSLLAPLLEGYLAIVKDFYEAYCIYMFLSFLISVLGRGDRNAVVEVLSKSAGHLKPPSAIFKRWYHPPPSESDWAKANAVLVECQILCMQFVFCRPLTSVASFLVAVLSNNDDTTSSTNPNSALNIATGNSTFFNSTDTMEHMVSDENLGPKLSFLVSPSFIIKIVQSISVGLAFSGLLKFYHAVSGELQWCQPFSKFLCIKGVVFMTFWQGLIISIVLNVHGTGNEDPVEKSHQIQNVLICLEMLFFSVAHWCTFPVEEWERDYRPRQYAKPGIGLKDFVSDMSVIMQQGNAARLRHRSESDVNSSLGSPELELTEESSSTLHSRGDTRIEAVLT